MPPKRKNDSSGTATKRARNATRKPKANQKAAVKQTDNNDFTKLCEAWFDRYKDQETQEQIITPEGCQTFFDDLDVSLDSIYPIVIGWKLNASRMGYFTKDEWMKGMQEHRIDSAQKLKNMLPVWDQSIKDDAMFKKLYLFTFGFAKTTGQKSMDVDVAMALWPIMLNPAKYPHIPSFVEFLRSEKPVKVINKDQWTSLLDFCRSVPDDLSNYDSSSSWPVLFDEFVEWKSKQDGDSMAA